MKWTKIVDKTPAMGRYLAICETKDKDFSWKGIVDVFFNPNIGWQRCEGQKDFMYVIAYIPMEEFKEIVGEIE